MSPTHPMIAEVLAGFDRMTADLVKRRQEMASGKVPVPLHQPRSTPIQRLYIRTMFGQLDLDTRNMSTFHRRFFTSAGVPQPAPNADLDGVLCTFTRDQANALIAVLKTEVPDESDC